MSTPEPFNESFTAGCDCVLEAAMDLPTDSYAEAFFTIREAWATESDVDDTNAVWQGTLTGGQVAIKDADTFKITIPHTVTRAMLKPSYTADFRVRATTGNQVHPAAVGVLRRSPNTTVSQ